VRCIFVFAFEKLEIFIGQGDGFLVHVAGVAPRADIGSHVRVTWRKEYVETRDTLTAVDLLASTKLALLVFAPLLGGCFGAMRPGYDACKAEVAHATRPPPGHPHKGMEGVWHCRYTDANGGAVNEKLTLAISPDGRTTPSGRNNYGENIVGDGNAGGSNIVIRFAEADARTMHLVSASMLDGKAIYYVNQTCYQPRLTCTR